MANLISKCIDGTRLAVLHFSLFLHLFSAFCSFFFLLPTALLQGGKHAREMFYILQTACGQNCSTEGTLSANTFAKIQLSNLPFMVFFKANWITSFITACDRLKCSPQVSYMPLTAIALLYPMTPLFEVWWGFGFWGDCFDSFFLCFWGMWAFCCFVFIFFVGWFI